MVIGAGRAASRHTHRPPRHRAVDSVDDDSDIRGATRDGADRRRQHQRLPRREPTGNDCERDALKVADFVLVLHPFRPTGTRRGASAASAARPASSHGQSTAVRMAATAPPMDVA